MNTVTVIGLGPMGAAISKVLINNGKRVTIWNRTKEKAESLVQEGAIFAPSVASAIRSSEVTLLSLANYEVTNQLLNQPEVISALQGKTLVQLSTGTPQEARDIESWAQSYQGTYLDGAIQAWPKHIGMEETTILFSGKEAVFQRIESLLKILAGNLIHMDEAVGTANAQSLSIISYLLGTWLGFAHGAHILESEGLRVDTFGSFIQASASILGDEAAHQGEIIQSDNFKNPESTLQSSVESVGKLVQHAKEAGINAEYPAFSLDLMKKALNAGYGNEEVSALIKVLRQDA